MSFSDAPSYWTAAGRHLLGNAAGTGSVALADMTRTTADAIAAFAAHALGISSAPTMPHVLARARVASRRAPRRRDRRLTPARPMPRYLLHHHHLPRECGAVFASFTGHESPLRHTPATASCPFGGHEIWWEVTADSEQAALALLPFYVAARTTVVPVAEVEIP